MRFDRESWRKLYTAESLEHRALPMFTRGLRDYLLRLAEVDGTLLRQTRNPAEDLSRALGIVDAAERRQLVRAIDQLLKIGYLTLQDGHLRITKFVEAQTAQTPGAKRQQAYRERRQQPSTRASHEASQVTSHPTRPDPTRPDPTRSPNPVGGDGSSDDDRDTRCPLDLVSRAETLGILQEFATLAETSVPVVRRYAEEFAGYWTVGGGAGKARRNWLGRLRQRLHELHQQGKLVAVEGDRKPDRPRVWTDPDPEPKGPVVPPPPELASKLRRIGRP